jgi:hypothetical protein
MTTFTTLLDALELPLRSSTKRTRPGVAGAAAKTSSHVTTRLRACTAAARQLSRDNYRLRMLLIGGGLTHPHLK